MPSPRGKRSPYKEAKSYVLQVSFRDRKLDETVCLCSEGDVLVHLEEYYGKPVSPDAVPCEVFKGLVLLENRGRGSLQI